LKKSLRAVRKNLRIRRGTEEGKSFLVKAEEREGIERVRVRSVRER